MIVLSQMRKKEQLQSMVLSAADSVKKSIRILIIADAPSYSSGIGEFTRKQRKAVVEQLGRSGLVSVEEDTAMQNHESRNILCRLLGWTGLDGYGM